MKKKNIILGILVAGTLAAMAQQTGKWGDQGDGTFRNPVIAADYCDPDPLRVGDDYYMVSSTFEGFPGIAVLHSKDLVNWETISTAFNHLDKVSEDYTWRRMNRYNGGVYAPTISHHNGRFYIYANLYTDGFYMATAERAEGPWKEQMLTDKYGRQLKVTRWSDPCPFWDDDGKAYLVASHPGREYWYSYMFQMSPDGTQLLDADSAVMAKLNTLYPWPDGGTVISPYFSSEGNRLFKRNGYYYFQHIEFTNKGQGEGTYVFRSRNIYGTHPDGKPGSPGNPGEYEKFCIEKVKDRQHLRVPGQGGYVTTPDGRWWWIGQFTREEANGRAPWLVPVTWIDNWPVIGCDISDMQGQTPMQMAKPVAGGKMMLPQGSDDFSLATLHPRWQWNHKPRGNEWSLTERKGWLRLKAYKPQGKQEGFFGASGTLAQKYMRSDTVVVTIRMDLRGLTEGGRAGLAIFNGGKSYANIGVRDGRMTVEADGNATVGDPLPRKKTKVYLRASIGFDAIARFSYSLDNRRYSPLGDAYRLRPGNFRGAMIGMFCYNVMSDGVFVDIDWFDYYIKH